MAKKDPVPKTQNAYVKWHDGLKTNVKATTPGCTADDVAMLDADNSDVHAKMTDATAADRASAGAHAALRQSLANSERNARALVQRIKKSTGYTTTLGDSLNIEGPEKSSDMSQKASVLRIKVKAHGVVEVGFSKEGAEGVHIYEDRVGGPVMNYLASETHSPYVDNRPLLVAGKPEMRRYKAILFIGKTEVGLESDVAEATARP